jgi:hypothetical protein
LIHTTPYQKKRRSAYDCHLNNRFEKIKKPFHGKERLLKVTPKARHYFGKVRRKGFGGKEKTYLNEVGKQPRNNRGKGDGQGKFCKVGKEHTGNNSVIKAQFINAGKEESKHLHAGPQYILRQKKQSQAGKEQSQSGNKFLAFGNPPFFPRLANLVLARFLSTAFIFRGKPLEIDYVFLCYHSRVWHHY